MVTIITLETLLRYGALIIFFLWWLYWRITERLALEEKPKHDSSATYAHVVKLIIFLAEVLLVIQLLGWDILPFNAPAYLLFSLQIVGFLIIVLGVSVGVSARKTLGANWTHAAEYQVKEKQELITTGIYRFIRHPIYAGLVLAFMGGQLLVGSYMVLAGIALFAGGYYQARLEEKLLIEHFGNSYKAYMKRTKMFFPFLW